MKEWVLKNGIVAVMAIVNSTALFFRVATWLVDHWVERLTDYESLSDCNFLNALRQYRYRRYRYRRFLKRSLDWADNFFGSPWSPHSFGICLTFAFIYPILLFFLSWIISGSYQFGQIDLFPSDWPTWIRLLFAAACVGYLFIADRLVRFQETIEAEVDEWLRMSLPGRQNGEGKSQRLLALMFLVLLSGGILHLTTHKISVSVSFAVAVAVAGGIAVDLTYRFRYVSAFSLGGSIAFLLTGAFALTGSFLLAGAFILAGAYTVVARGRSTMITTGVGGVIGATFGVITYTTVLYLTGVQTSIFDTNVIFFSIFFVFLPLLNGLFDWVSWAVSRRLGKSIYIRNFPPLLVATYILLDFIFAVLLLILFFFTIGFTFSVVDYVVYTSNMNITLNFQTTLLESVKNPIQIGFWLFAMISSTFVPTFLHSIVSLGALNNLKFSLGSPREYIRWIIDALRENRGLSKGKASRVSSYLVLYRWLPAIMLALFVLFVFLWILVSDVQKMLLSIVEMSGSVVGGSSP